MTRSALIIILILIAAPSIPAQTSPTLNTDPKAVKFVTSDIENFWRAYDLAKSETDRTKRIAIFQTEYLDKGSPGLKDFLALRIRSAENLVARIDRMPKYYASIRGSTLGIAKMERRLRAAFAKFKTIYPEAVFPNVYFLVGTANSGGTTGASGLLIGAEMYGMTKGGPTDELTPWLHSVISDLDMVPAIVAHESCHYNQRLAIQKTLLDRSLGEGSCDLVGELISGGNINERLKAYGRTHDAEIWRNFKAAMDGTDTSDWLYNAGNAKDKPADLGYYAGYLISRAYYQKAKDKRRAVRDILNIHDYRVFLAESGYDGPKR